MLSARNIHKKYNHLEVLKGVDIDIKQGEIVSIVGSSGAGKSTLLHILGTLDKADMGEISIHDQVVNKLSAKKLAAFRNRQIGTGDAMQEHDGAVERAAAAAFQL